MKKYTTSILLLFCSIACMAQQITYDKFKLEAKTELNLRPEYGDLKKDKKNDAINREFIKTALKQDELQERHRNI